MTKLADPPQTDPPDSVVAPDRPIEDLDVLRGFAIIMVFVGNVPYNLFPWRSSFGALQDTFWNGSAGIDLFLAITGFTTARALLPRPPASPAAIRLENVLAFVVRRFRRRTMLAWAWVAVPLILSLGFNRSNAFHPFMADLASGIAAVLEVNNIWLAHVVGSGDGGIVFPYWMLSLGTQFAVLLPALAIACGRRLPLALACLLAYTFVMPQEPLSFYTRPGALALGALLAIASHHEDYRLATPYFLGHSGGMRAVFIAVSLVLLGTTQSSLLRPLVSVPFGLSALIAGGLVYVASLDARYIVGTGPFRRVGAWLGQRSYELYLIHVPAFALTRELYARFRPPMWVATANQAEHLLVVAVVLTALISEASYRVFQRSGVRGSPAPGAR